MEAGWQLGNGLSTRHDRYLYSRSSIGLKREFGMKTVMMNNSAPTRRVTCYMSIMGRTYAIICNLCMSFTVSNMSMSLITSNMSMSLITSNMSMSLITSNMSTIQRAMSDTPLWFCDFVISSPNDYIVLMRLETVALCKRVLTTVP